jgi:hypothetical protein
MTSTSRSASLLALALGVIALNFPVCAQAPAPTPAPAAAPGAAAAAAAPALDFGDGTSETLTTKAWKSLEAGDYASVKGYTDHCIAAFKTQATQMQGTLKAPAPKESAAQMWALNDVGTCYFIQGQADEKLGDKAGAIAAYKALSDNFSFAQCWDPKGWFWSPADAARKRLTELQFDAQ